MHIAHRHLNGNGVPIGVGAWVRGPIAVRDVAGNTLVLYNAPPGAKALGVPAHIVERNPGAAT